MRPGRPYGLTLALLACAVVYGLYPLAEALLYLVFGLRSGNEPTIRVLISITLSLTVLVLVALAWQGRPSQVRIILSVVIVGAALLGAGLAIVDLTNRAASPLLDSTTAASNTINRCSLPIYLLVALYSVWYLNRYPSRAFFAGRFPDAGADAGDS